jgi:hypothetical protein
MRGLINSTKNHPALGIGERGQHAIAGGKIAIGVDGLQTDMGGAGRKMRAQTAPTSLIPKFANEDASI